MTRIHVALCVICGEGIKRQGEVVSPALYPFNLTGFHRTDRAHHKCANAHARGRVLVNGVQDSFGEGKKV